MTRAQTYVRSGADRVIDNASFRDHWGIRHRKTSIISLLGREVATVPEPAGDLIKENRVADGEPTLDHRPELFVERLVQRSIENYRSASGTTVTVFDRGLPDYVAYLPGGSYRDGNDVLPVDPGPVRWRGQAFSGEPSTAIHRDRLPVPCRFPVFGRWARESRWSCRFKEKVRSRLLP